MNTLMPSDLDSIIFLCQLPQGRERDHHLMNEAIKTATPDLEAMSVQELQLLAARYQQALVYRVCGDPVRGVGLNLISNPNGGSL